MRVALGGLLVVAASSVLAQYKVVAPDGSVTYTDRPPTSGAAKISTMAKGVVNEVSPQDTLPAELKLATARFPVVLYTAADCAPCDAGRQMLIQRGVPFTEKLIVSEDDAAAFERALGSRTVPALTIGSQVMRGLSADEWNAYLDAARYPRESRLPRGWQGAAAEPLAVRNVARPVPAVPAVPALPPQVPELPARPADGLRF
jgi:glutaredoxin